VKTKQTDKVIHHIKGILIICWILLTIQTTVECKPLEPQISIPNFKWELVGIYDNDLQISIDMNNVECNEDGIVRYWTKNESMYPDSEFYTLDYDEVKLREKTMCNIKRLIYYKTGEVKVIEYPFLEGRILESGPVPLEIKYLINNHPKLEKTNYKETF